jgi:hypothetical protein
MMMMIIIIIISSVKKKENRRTQEETNAWTILPGTCKPSIAKENLWFGYVAQA